MSRIRAFLHVSSGEILFATQRELLISYLSYYNYICSELEFEELSYNLTTSLDLVEVWDKKQKEWDSSGKFHLFYDDINRINRIL